MPPGPALRTIELPSPSGRAEAGAVLQTVGAIAVVALLVIGRHAPSAGASSAAALEAPDYQVLFRDLPAAEQRTFRAIQEGLTEAELRRPALGAWPAPEALAAEGIPPFAADPLGPPLRWTLTRSGADATYLGVRSGGPGASYLLLVQEPPPGTPGDPPSTPLDEIHHRLSNGTVIHVSIWQKTSSGPVEVSAAALARPYLDGWKQILIAPPSAVPPPER